MGDSHKQTRRTDRCYQFTNMSLSMYEEQWTGSQSGQPSLTYLHWPLVT